MKQGLEDVSGLLELAVEADDEETFNEAVAELDALGEKLAQLEFRRMFSGEYDSAEAKITRLPLGFFFTLTVSFTIAVIPCSLPKSVVVCCFIYCSQASTSAPQ